MHVTYETHLAVVLIISHQGDGQERREVRVVKVSQAVAQPVDLVGVHPHPRLQKERVHGRSKRMGDGRVSGTSRRVTDEREQQLPT